MPQQVALHRVFIASPSDVDEERSRARATISLWNAANASRLGVVLEPVGWETHARAEMGGEPQSKINPLLDECDLLVGIFAARLGTATTRYDSGTHEEIEEFVKAKGPENALLFFRSEATVNIDALDPDEIERFNSFKSEMKAQSLYISYSNAVDFDGKLRHQLDLHAPTSSTAFSNSSNAGDVTSIDDSGGSKLAIEASEIVSTPKLLDNALDRMSRNFQLLWKLEIDEETYSEPTPAPVIDRFKNALSNLIDEYETHIPSDVLEALKKALSSLDKVRIGFVNYRRDDSAEFLGRLDAIRRRIDVHSQLLT